MNTEDTTISVTGNAAVHRQPDSVFITLYVIANGILLEDAVKQAVNKTQLIDQTLRDTFADIREIQIKDMYVGESNASSFGRFEKAEPPKPEVIKCLLVSAPPISDLAINIIDTASRMGCSIQNPADTRYGYLRGAVFYGLMNYASAEQEAIEAAIVDAKQNASNAARIVNKRSGFIKQISSVETFRMNALHDESNRVNRNMIVLPTSYLSVSSATVEVSAKVSVTFALENET
jgi:uncharacterized protein YggE